MQKRFKRGCLALVFITIALFVLVPLQAYAASMSDLQAGFESFMSHAQSLYRLDAADMDKLWEAYCGEMDPQFEEDKTYARQVGQELQSREAGLRGDLLENELPKLLQLAKDFQQSSATDPKDVDTAKDIEASLLKQQTILQNLRDNVVLKGSNHPFVQFAIEYGKQQHIDMCSKFGVSSTRVCDQRFPDFDGRPDLVVMDGGRLMVYEFKPDNVNAIKKGKKQLLDYVPVVEAYYEDYFVDGREGGFKKQPEDSDHGGQAMLDALANSPEAWSGNQIAPKGEIATYKTCDERVMFNF
jgi:hypothetical protein